MKTYAELHRELLCEEVNRKGRSRKTLCSKICKEVKEGMRTSKGVIGGVEFPHDYEFYDNTEDSVKTRPPIGYFGTVTVQEDSGQMTHYEPDSTEVLEAWVDASETPTRIHLDYGEEFIPSEEGGGKHCGEHGFVISFFKDEEGDNDTISIGIGDGESVWWEKYVHPSALEREFKRLRLLLPILGYALLETEFHSAEPE